MRCLELATEVRLLAVDAGPAFYSAVAVAVADGGGPFPKALDLIAAADAHAGGASCAAVVAVSARLARERAAAPAAALAAALAAHPAWLGRPTATRAAALNATARACARGGDLEGGLALLAALRGGALAVDDGTFAALSLAALAGGRPDLAEELLEERDYL